MVKKYKNNYRLDIAYATIFRNVNAIEEIPIHTALNITSGNNLTKNDMVAGSHIVYGGGGDTGNTHSEFNIDYKTIGIGRVGARCGCVFEILPNSWVTDNALLIQSYDQRFSLDFLRHFLSHSDLGQYANNAMQPVISKTRIKDVTIPLIGIEEQNALSKILDLIEKNEKFESLDYTLLIAKNRIIDNWEILNEEIENQKDLTINLKQAIIQEAIQGKLTADWREQNPKAEPASELLECIKAEKVQLIKDKKIKKGKTLPPITAEEIPFELPKGWVWTKLGDIGKSIIGLIYKPENVNDSGIPVLRANNILDFKLIETNLVHVNCEVPENKIAQVGDILICVRSGSKKLIGKSAIITKPGFSFGAFNTLYKSIFNEYIHLFLMSRTFTNQINDEKSTGINQLTQGVLRNLLIPFPPFEEQKAIVEKIEGIMQKHQALEEEIKNSEANAQMLMQAVLKEAFESNKEIVGE